MRRERRPDDRYLTTVRAAQEPRDAAEAALWRFRVNGTADDVTVRVVDAYEDVFEREVLQAWIFAGASDDVINAKLGVSVDVLPVYRHLCCDVFLFRDKLEMLRWARNYRGSREGRLMLERAMHHDGIEALSHLCGLDSNIDPSHVNEQVMKETYFRGVGTLRGSNISSSDASAAHQMLKTATASAAVAQKRGAPNIADTLLKLKHRELTFQVEDITPRGEILH